MNREDMRQARWAALDFVADARAEKARAELVQEPPQPLQDLGQLRALAALTSW